MRQGYGALARVYDQLMEFDYPSLANFYDTIFQLFNFSPKTLLDLACGTGRLTSLLAGKGIDMVGTDASPEMLSLASSNLGTETDVLLLCQNMQDLDLNDTVDGVVCALDGINHLTSLKEVQTVFRKVSLFTNPGGIFIFDVHSLMKMQKTLGQNTFVYDTPGCYCVWQNHWIPSARRVDYSLQIFIRNGSAYQRMDDAFTEFYYSPLELSDALSEAGFTVLLTTAGQTLDPYEKQHCDRHFIIAKKNSS